MTEQRESPRGQERRKQNQPAQQLTYNSYINLIYGGRHHLDTRQETSKNVEYEN